MAPFPFKTAKPGTIAHKVYQKMLTQDPEKTFIPLNLKDIRSRMARDRDFALLFVSLEDAIYDDGLVQIHMASASDNPAFVRQEF